MMLIGLDSTDKIASVALWRDGRLVDVRRSEEQRRHSDSLLPLMDALIHENGCTLADVDCFCVDIGPGSFTGVRIGTASINAIAHALNKKVIGVSALDILYEMAGCPANALILIDAGGGRAYGEQYADGKRTKAPSMGTRESFLEMKPIHTAIIENLSPTAEALCAAAERRLETASDAAYPVYLAPSQAERLFEQRREAAK